MLESSAQVQRILVVDDDPAILRLVRDRLEASGFDVATAASGQQALDVVERRGLPHLAIVDIHMPGMDGFDFCETVQQYADVLRVFADDGPAQSRQKARGENQGRRPPVIQLATSILSRLLDVRE